MTMNFGEGLMVALAGVIEILLVLALAGIIEIEIEGASSVFIIACVVAGTSCIILGIKAMIHPTENT